MTRPFTNSFALLAAVLLSFTLLAQATSVPASTAHAPALATILA